MENINEHNILIDLQKNESERSFNINIFLKLNLYDKNHNVLYKYIIKNLNDFKQKCIYFKIIESTKNKDIELISNINYLKNFNSITKFLLSLQSNNFKIINQSTGDIDLSEPEKDLIFKLF